MYNLYAVSPEVAQLDPLNAYASGLNRLHSVWLGYIDDDDFYDHFTTMVLRAIALVFNRRNRYLIITEERIRRFEKLALRYDMQAFNRYMASVSCEYMQCPDVTKFNCIGANDWELVTDTAAALRKHIGSYLMFQHKLGE